MHVNHRRSRLRGAAIAVLCVAVATPLAATELVYVPTNPVFGANSLNGNALLSAAQMTNKHKEPAAPAARQNALQQFTELLERSVLSQLASAATSGVMGAGGKLRPGTVETGNFRIEIVDAGGGILTITTTDKTTGDTTSFQIGGQG